MNEMQVLTAAGTDAKAELQRLRRLYATTGLYPVLFGSAEDFERVEEGREDADDSDVAAIIEASRAIDPARWAAERVEAEPELFEDEEGDWPARPVPKVDLVTHLDLLSGKPHREVKIGLLKAAAPWEVFAHLNWGGWNDCPHPAEHCAIHRDWGARFGAEVVSVTGAVVQCFVARPPTTRAAAMKLAREHYVYCYDIVAQGAETIAHLAASLLDAETWYFWWD